MTQPRLLYLGNGRSFQSVAKLDERFESWGLSVDRYWAYNNEFPDTLDGYDGIFLSGSPHGAYENVPFINREHDLIEKAAEKQIPMLGICFGSQILGSALCGRDQVFRRDDCEIGYKTLTTSDEAKDDLLTAEVGESFDMFVWHNDEVKAEHPDMTILARTDICPNQVWRYHDAPIWGIQGHPEVTRVQAPIWFEQNRARMEKDGADVDRLKSQADEAATAKTMLARYVQFLVQN